MHFVVVTFKHFARSSFWWIMWDDVDERTEYVIDANVSIFITSINKTLQMLNESE